LLSTCANKYSNFKILSRPYVLKASTTHPAGQEKREHL
jgi:hypothetical protein